MGGAGKLTRVLRITLGYHRLWSHRSIEASFPLRVVLAGMGCLGFQGSIKCVRRMALKAETELTDPASLAGGGFYGIDCITASRIRRAYVSCRVGDLGECELT